jgi:hypothetical protein
VGDRGEERVRCVGVVRGVAGRVHAQRRRHGHGCPNGLAGKGGRGALFLLVTALWTRGPRSGDVAVSDRGCRDQRARPG